LNGCGRGGRAICNIASLLLEESAADKALNFLDAMYTQEFGGKFISYDMEKWIFRVPHFNR